MSAHATGTARRSIIFAVLLLYTRPIYPWNMRVTESKYSLVCCVSLMIVNGVCLSSFAGALVVKNATLHRLIMALLLNAYLRRFPTTLPRDASQSGFPTTLPTFSLQPFPPEVVRVCTALPYNASLSRRPTLFTFHASLLSKPSRNSINTPMF